MLDTIMESGAVNDGTQRSLYELMLAAGDEDGLATLAKLPDLAPDLDDKLSSVTSLKVRSAWLTRPGRSTEEIAALVGKESRVGVLAELAASSLDSPALYQVVLDRASSPKVLLPLMANPSVPRKVREDASRRIATCKLNGVQSRELGQVWFADAWLKGPALETCAGIEMLKTCLSAPTASEAATRNALAVLEKYTARMEEALAAQGVRWRALDPVPSVARCLATLVTADWCDTATKVAAVALVERLQVVAAAPKSSNTYYLREVASAAEAVARALDGGDSVGGLMSRAKAAATKDEVAGLVAELKGVDATMRQSVLDQLARNPRLDVAAQALVVPAMTHPERRAILDRQDEYPDATGATLVLCGTSERPSGHVAELVVANLALVPAHRVWRVLEATMTDEMPDELVAQLPCTGLSTLVKNTGAGSDARARVGRYLARELDGAPTTLWAQFDQMHKEFAGTLGELLDVCRATSGV